MSTTRVPSSTSCSEVAPRNASSPSSSPLSSVVAEAVAPLDLAEEGFAVLGVANRARAGGKRALRSERLDPPAVIGEAIAHPRDRDGEEAASSVDVLAELREDEVARYLVDAPVLDVRDEQPGSVGSQIDGGDTHRSTTVTERSTAAAV